MRINDVAGIDAELAARLAAAGIDDLRHLRELGSIQALRRLGLPGHRRCCGALLALEAAIRGVQWTEIQANERAWLKEQWEDVCSSRHSATHEDA